MNSLEIVTYEKVGTLTNKVWSNLLGDIYNGARDLGLGYITVNDERQRDMRFTHPLIRYTYVNIFNKTTLVYNRN